MNSANRSTLLIALTLIAAITCAPATARADALPSFVENVLQKPVASTSGFNAVYREETRDALTQFIGCCLAARPHVPAGIDADGSDGGRRMAADRFVDDVLLGYRR